MRADDLHHTGRIKSNAWNFPGVKLANHLMFKEVIPI
jgi:hypothetical protein